MSEILYKTRTMNPRLSGALERLQGIWGNQYLIIACITIMAAGLRFYKLGEWSFWIDEMYTINRAQVHFSDPTTLIRNLPTTLWLPLSVMLTEGFLIVFGVTEWSARLASTLIAIISIPILFFFARKFIGSNVALILALLLAISPWHVFWSQNARFYTSLLLLYTLAGFAFFYAIERDRPIYILYFYLLFYFALSERMLAIFIFPMILLYLAMLWLFNFQRPPGLRKRNILLLILPMLGIILFDALRRMMTGSSFILDTFNDFFGRTIDDPVRISILIIFNIGVPLVILALLSGVYLIKEKNRLGLFLFISSVVTSLGIAFISLFAFIADRFAFMTLPGWIILASFGVIEAYRKFRPKGFLLGVGALLLLIADAGGSHLMYYQVNQGNRPEWRQAFQFVTDRAEKNDILVSSVQNLGSYYAKREVVALEDFNYQDFSQGSNRVWFVLDSENSWFAGEQKKWVEENADLVEFFYLRVRERINIKIYFYNQSYINPAW
jgi:mannosyltransferase